MSLISLSSADKNHHTSQQPFNFKNNFPQPIVIKPNSQVALVNFYHFRDDDEYVITRQNNTIVYNFGNPNSNGRWRAVLNPDRYSGADLATEIARALNESNIAYQNYTFSCAFTVGNPVANPITNDVFEITFVSVATPAENAGTWTNLLNDNATIAVDGTTTTIDRTAGSPNAFSVVQEEKGIHNHEGTWQTSGWTTMDGSNTTFLNDAGNQYEYTFGAAKIMGLYAEDLCSLNNPDPTKTFNRERATFQVKLRGTDMVLSRLLRTTNAMAVKRTLPLVRGGTLHTALSNLLFTNTQRWKDITYRFKFIKDGSANFAIQLQVSGDGGLTYVVPTEANDTGGTFGVNADLSPNVYGQKTINTVNYNGLIYQSKQNGNPAAAGGNNTGLDAANILNKAYGKYRCIVSTDDNFIPAAGGTDIGNSRFDLLTKTFNVNYLAGGSQFDLVLVEHTGGNAFDYNVTTSNQAGTPAAGELVATDLTSHALKVNLTKNALGLVFDIHEDDTNAASAVVGELHFDRLATTNSQSGNISLRSFAGTLAGKTEIFNVAVPGTPAQARTRTQITLTVTGIFNPANRNVLSSSGLAAPEEHHAGNHIGVHDEATLTEPLVGVDLSQRLVLLMGRITQEDIDNTPGIGNSPFNLTINTPSGTIGKLIGFSANILSMATPATNQPVDPTNPFRSDTKTLVIAKDTTLHVSIPELAGVKSFEGESSQQYKTIKVIPKSDFEEGRNGSLSFTANYQDFIDINNANELQLSELTVQVREPSGVMAISLEPVTRCTIKIRQDPTALEAERSTQIMDRLERMMSQNQKQVQDPNPDKVYT